MSDPSEPRRPATTDPPAPAPAPPTAAVDSRAMLVQYFLRNEGRYTPEALRGAASAAGYSAEDIAAAWSQSQIGLEGRASSGRFANPARLIVLALYLATFVLLVAFSTMSERTYGVGPPILAVALLVTGAISLARVGQTRLVSKDPLLALAGMLAVPFVLLVIVAGLCVLTTSPRFFPAAG